MLSRPRRTRRRQAIAAGLVALTTIVATLAAAPAEAASYAVKGRLVDTSGKPLANVSVTFADFFTSNPPTTTRTGADGRFAGTLGSEGNVCFNDDGAHRDYEETCQGIDVDSPASVGDVVLRHLTTVTGTLSSGPAAELAPYMVVAQGDVSGLYESSFDSTYDASSGRYTFSGVPEGTYTVCFRTTADQSPYGCIGGSWPESATPVKVGTVPVTVPARSLPSPGTLSGRVSNFGPDGGRVKLYRRVTRDGETWWENVTETEIASSSGSYAFSAPSDTYTLSFESNGTGTLLTYYKDQVSLDRATAVTVAAGKPTTLGDQALINESVIKGKLKLPAGALDNEGRVVVRDASTGDQVDASYVESDGTYEVHGLAAGSYKVDFDRRSGTAIGAAQFFSNVAESLGASAASLVQLSTGQTRTGVDATITRGRVFLGRVVDDAGDPISGARVLAYTEDGSLVTRSVDTDGDGRFSLTGLTTGSYHVAVDRRHGLGIRFYTGSPSLSATKISATGMTAAAQGSDLGQLVFGDAVLQPVTGQSATISGTPRVGSTLTASPGGWTPSGAAYAYQWSAAGSPIAGATSATYVAKQSDVGKALTVRVTASKTGYASGSSASAATTAVQPITVTRGTAAITGTPKVGSVLTAVTSGWAPSDVTFTYRWMAGGTTIAGATGKTFTPTSAHVGKAITLAVTGSRTGSPATTPVVSAATSAVAPIRISRGTVAVTGTSKVGYTLTAVPSGWSPSDVAYAYRWRANGAVIPGATGRTFAPGAAQVGRSLSVEVTGSRAGSPAVAPAVSAGTAKVAAGTLRLVHAPSIRGVSKSGAVLSSSAGSVSPAGTPHYQWLRNGAAISRATGSSYRLTKYDVKRYVSLRVTYSRAGYANLVRVTNRVGAVRK